jgi:hypothetical protein
MMDDRPESRRIDRSVNNRAASSFMPGLVVFVLEELLSEIFSLNLFSTYSSNAFSNVKLISKFREGLL